ncbi:MAG TPA: extracellular solute-binding protein [Pseudolabrys sp.]|jgi:microcin C transport system substrate-binding protein|nr:extracellular solute-binding protein [Pseudolabrys sp.]
MKFSRRSVLRATASSVVAPALAGIGAMLPCGPVLAQPETQAQTWKHALSLFGDTKYPEGFEHFDYVNSNAPQGGTVRQIAFGTFDNFNTVVAGVKGSIASGTELFMETLTTPALDEISTEYGLLAEAVSYPDDHSMVTYRLRTNARWHDGKPITPDDVLYSYEVLKKNSPFYGAYYRHVVKAEKTGEREIRFTFDGPGNRELPQIVGQLPVLPKHWWEGNDKSGHKRDVTQTTLEPPLGSGPYRLKDFAPGRTLVYEKVDNYWGKDLNVIIGTRNFQTIRYEYFRDSTVALEAFKADQVDWRFENSAKDWANSYDFPAVRDHRVIREEFPIRNVGIMQAFAFNVRREKFKDPRVRRAFNFTFDFEEMNRQLFSSQYKRIASYFDGTELAATGVPSGKELEILEAVRDKVPPDLFTKPYTNPVGGNPQAVRNNLREALALLHDAGYEIRDTKLVDAKSGEPLAVEFLVDEPAAQRFVLFYKPSLERTGMKVDVRVVDAAQYENRLRQWDFDIIVASWTQSLSPGNEQRGFWSSQAADQPGSRNLIGIKNPAVDALIERVIFTKDREDLVAATKALDRVLLWNFYVVPQWTYPFVRSARWDRFGRPETMPKYGRSGFPSIWWWDAARAAKVQQRS